ncbi:MAG: hypothetical protein BWZ03_00862 [bacterium ADurb.BinA186]|nr:MAG: hypothetical protein BWZ03_00862 [bacterium ADurb.BinA186]
MTLKCIVLIGFIQVFGALSALGKTPQRAVVELGESQVQGTKAEHEEIIIVSRAPVDVSIQTITFSGKEKIRKEVKTSMLFDVSYGD